jgi:hypothetical protein
MSDTKKKKATAKKLLTQFIRQIAEQEHDSPIVTGPDIDDARMVTKAEALAHFIWKAALGFKEEVRIVDKDSGEISIKERVVFPDKHYIDIVLDRMEGKVSPAEPEKASSKASVADRVSKESKNRLNNLAKK